MMQYVSRQVGDDGKSWSGKSAATRKNPARTPLEICQLFNVGWHQNHAESRSAGRFWIMERLFLIEFNIREVIETLVLNNVSNGRLELHLSSSSVVLYMIQDIGN